jgi:DNA-binding MarR family transcriptional regulator
MEAKTITSALDADVQLTNNEKRILWAFSNNEYTANNVDEHGIGGGTWTFAIIDNAGGLSQQAAGGVLSSLIQKGLVHVDGDYTVGDESETTASLTARGKDYAVALGLAFGSTRPE